MIELKDIPDYSIILADSYLHHEIRKELCKDKKGRILSVLSFSNYIKPAVSIDQDEVLFSYYKKLKPLEGTFPVLKSILYTKQFLNEIYSFHTKRVKYQIDLNSLPENSLAEKELSQILNITKDIRLPIEEETDSFHRILQQDLSNVYIIEGFMDKYEEKCIHALYKKGAHKISVKEVPPETSFYYAKNIRQEVESVAQYITNHNLDVEDIKISISDNTYQPFITQIFERYQIPYRFIRQTKASNTMKRFLSVLNYAEKKDANAFLDMLDYNLFKCKYPASLDNYMRLFKKDIHDNFHHIHELDITYDIISEIDIQRLEKMEEEAEISRNEIIEKIDDLLKAENFRDIFKKAYDITLQSLNNVKDETENLTMIQKMIQKHTDNIQHWDDYHFFMELCKDLTTSLPNENMNSLPVLSITQPYFYKKYHFVLGCLESSYPAFPVENGIFDEDYMQNLHYPTMQERFEFHKSQCLSALKTNENIIFSYPAGNFDGKSNESSLMIETFANKKPVLFPLNEYTFTHQMNRYKNIENASDLYVKDHKIHGSVSSIEMYVKCPYSYFLKYGLKIKEPIENKLSDHTTGTFMHYILETLVNTYKKEYVNVEEDKIKEIIHDKIVELIQVYPQKKDEFVCLETRILKTMLNTIENLKSHEAASKLTPEKCEETFEFDIPITDDIRWSLKGIVDRIDMDNDYFRIVDYKSSIKDLSEEKVFEALQLQLLTYLMVVKHKFNKKPIGAYYYSFKNENVALDAYSIGRRSTKAYTVEENGRDEYKIKHAMAHRMNGWSTSFDINIIDDDATHIKGLKISDDEVSASKIYHPDVLEEYFMEMYRIIGEKVLSGDISCIPEESACMFCPYASICRNGKAVFKRDPLIEIHNDLYLKGGKAND